MKVKDLKASFQYGMHGCGYYKGTNHVNTLEALRYWCNQGVKVMEIDIAKTIDGKFVALAHKMNAHYLKMLEINPYRDTSNDKFTENWFMRQRLCSKTTTGLTPMNLTSIIEEMSSDDELIVMFDLWRMWEEKETYAFSEELVKCTTAEIRDRCVIEVYNKSMLKGIREADTKLNIMYCVHAPKEPEFDENVSPTILKELGVDIISYPWQETKSHPGEIDSYRDAGFIIFSLSKTNRYGRQMEKAGVNVNLVDVLYKPNNFLKLWLQRENDKLKLRTRRFSRVQMDEMTVEEVHRVALEMMKEFHDFCVENDIKYSLAYGSLIGAIRHKGFIPWDDDIDVWMTRPNFEKFTRLYKSKNGFRHSSMYDDDSLICFDRIYETKFTYLKTGVKSCSGETGVWVDIMPLDSVPDDILLRNKQYDIFCRMNADMIDARLWLRFVRKGGNWQKYVNILRMIMRKILRGNIGKLSRRNIYATHRDELSLIKKYSNLQTSCYCYFQCGDAYKKRKQELLPARSFAEYVNVTFENTEFMIVADYDNLLKRIYGDYMTLPPEDKRHKSHGICFWK